MICWSFSWQGKEINNLCLNYFGRNFFGNVHLPDQNVEERITDGFYGIIAMKMGCEWKWFSIVM